MKKFLLVFTILALLGYLAFIAIYLDDNTQDKVCHSLKVLVKDSIDKQFIQAKDIEQLLRKATRNLLVVILMKSNVRLLLCKLRKSLEWQHQRTGVLAMR